MSQSRFRRIASLPSKVFNPRARVKLLFALRERALSSGSSLAVRVVTYRLARWGVYVHPSTKIEGELLMGHPVGIVIGQGVCVEPDVGIWQNVTIGTREIGSHRPEDYPVIRRGARLFAGAVVIGGIEVGAGAVVGANSVVTRDVAPGATVGGVPARVLGTAGSG